MNSVYANAFVGILQLAVPSYGLRLNRHFGTRQVGWALVAAFLGLVLLNLVGSMGAAGAQRESEVARAIAMAAIPVLLLIGLAHVETLLRQRARLENQHTLRSCELEQVLEKRTKELAHTRQEFHTALFRKREEQKAFTQRWQDERLELAAFVAANAGQHLNRHIAIIELYAKLLLAKESDARRFEYFERLVAGAVAARGLGRQLLACAGQQQLRMQLVHMAEIVRRHEPGLRDLLGEHCSLEYCHPLDTPEVWADPHAVRWMLEELLCNARTAMPAGGRISVAVEPVTVNQLPSGSAVGANQFVSVVVTDVGHGATRDVQKHMGEPFFTTGRGRTGLGLANVSGLMRAHGGQLAITSAPGHGTVARLLFPAAPPCPPGNRQAFSQGAPTEKRSLETSFLPASSLFPVEIAPHSQGSLQFAG